MSCSCFPPIRLPSDDLPRRLQKLCGQSEMSTNLYHYRRLCFGPLLGTRRTRHDWRAQYPRENFGNAFVVKCTTMLSLLFTVPLHTLLFVVKPSPPYPSLMYGAPFQLSRWSMRLQVHGCCSIFRRPHLFISSPIVQQYDHPRAATPGFSFWYSGEGVTLVKGQHAATREPHATSWAMCPTLRQPRRRYRSRLAQILCDCDNVPPTAETSVEFLYNATMLLAGSTVSACLRTPTAYIFIRHSTAGIKSRER